MESCCTIMAINQSKRVKTAVEVQEVLTKYGCSINLRVGIHEGVLDKCSNNGLILLQVVGEKAVELKKELEALEGVKVKSMEIDF